MKFYSVFLGIMLFSTTFAQKAMTFEQAKEQGIRITYLDSTYKSGIHADTALAVFKKNPEAYTKTYERMLQEFGEYLKANNYEWLKPTKGFNRIYFNRTGKIDYFLYSFKPNQISVENEIKFGELLGQFIMTYQFPLRASVDFAQCSPVTYTPAVD